jgi:hypothetical protein
MKKICLLSIALFLVCAANAQNEVTQPAPTLEQKYNMTRLLFYNCTLGLITLAKNDGITPEELGKKTGELMAWGEDATFQNLAGFVVMSMACSADSVNVIERSDDKVVIIVPHLYALLENQGELYGSTVEDYVAWWNGAMGEVARRLDMSCEYSLGEEGIKIVVAQ